ncbi:ABC transporter permease [Halomonas aquatica]|uniref:FtsX-like permease family protein n=1 Tax=Halomonas aquatica TaxID=3151123 RepID=A0ABV1NEX7_9GAMM
MRALHRKLLRDLGRLKGQALAIAVVVAGGVMTLILSVTMLGALTHAQQRFYASHHFAEVFVDVKRAPLGLVERLQNIPGVNLIEARVGAPVRLAVADFDDPVRGQMVSIPDGRQPTLNRLHLVAGHLPTVGREEQVVVSDAFAEAHGLTPGDSVEAIINGRRTPLTLSGIALSPEFLYQAGPTDLVPDYRRYAILWMNQQALADAYGMNGAFNQLSLTLQSGADRDSVIDALDLALSRYGGTGARTRHDQQSHRFLEEELKGQRAQARILPTIFLLVSAFLLNVVMTRIIRTQREQIAILKAFGYRDSELARHYAGLALLIVLLGWALGVGLGAWTARWMADLYAEYFRFPEMRFPIPHWALALSLLLAGLSALTGSWRAVWQAVSAPPAEAMRPPAPQRFHRTWLERSPLRHALGNSGRIVLRHLARQPAKMALSVTGIALSAGLLIMGAWQIEALDRMLDRQYRDIMRMDIELTFGDPAPTRAVGELRHLPGVLAVEPWRRVPATLINGHRRYRTGLLGLEAVPRLRQIVDEAGNPQPLPPEGLVLTRYLGQRLGVGVGDSVEVAIMEGHRRRLSLPVAALVEEPIGVGAYLRRDRLNHLMREGPAISGAWLLVDDNRRDDLIDELHDLPVVAGIGLMDEAENGVRRYLDETLLVFAIVFVILAGSIAFGVIYNNARITFAERARELATLLILGYTRAEVSRILLGEIALLGGLAIIPGWAIGIGFCTLLSEAFSNDLFRIPLAFSPRIFGLSAAGVVSASALVGLLMLRRLWRLDQVAVLKAPE